jgi:hypothetical protein
MNLSLLAQPFLQFPDAALGFLYTAMPGTGAGPAQAYPKTTYVDSAGVTANMNPIALDSNGRASVFWDGYYDVALYDSTGNLIFTQSNVSGQQAIGSISLQWIPQSTPTYVSATQFSVPGNQTSIFTAGTAIQASIAGGTISGIIQSSSVAGNPQVTTVTVSWFSTSLNASVSAISTSPISAGVTGNSPILPIVTIPAAGGTYTMTYASLQQIFIVPSNLGAALTIVLPSASGLPPGSFIRVRNTYTGSTYTVQFTATISGVVNPYMLGMDWEIFSDGTSWRARVTPVRTVGISYSLNNVCSTGATSTTWASLQTALASLGLPTAASAIIGAAYMTTSGTGLLAPTATGGGAANTGYAALAFDTSVSPFRIALTTPQTLYYLVTANYINVTLSGYEL